MSQQHQEEEFSLKNYFVPLTTLKAVHWIVIIGIIVFFNSLFNPFVLDDHAQATGGMLNGLKDIPLYFSKGEIFSGNASVPFFYMHYKPLLHTFYALINYFLGSSPFPFHAVQLLLHITNSILVFLILSKSFDKRLSFFLSLIMLVHPINNETVIYIADLQDVLFIFFGLLAYYILMKNNIALLSYKKTVLISLLFFSSLLSKETGILFSAVYFFYTLLYAPKNFKRIIIAILSPVALYIFLRFIASLPPVMATIDPSMIQREDFLIRMQTMPKIIFYYISHFLFPTNLAVSQEWLVRSISFSNFFLPLILDICAVSFFYIFGIVIYQKRKDLFNQYLFFTSWFLFGLFMHSQIIALDFTVADRWFYFPIIGLLGSIGTLLIAFKNVFKKIIKNLAITLSFISIVILSVLTIIRNSQWQTTMTLYSHDVKYAESPTLYSYYAGLLMVNGKYDEAKPILEKSVALNPNLGSNINNLAKWYENKKDFIKAKELYWKNINLNNGVLSYKSISYAGLSRIALYHDRNPQEAKKLSQLALKENQINPHILLFLALSEYQLGEQKEAMQTMETVYKYDPSIENQRLYLYIKDNKEISIIDSLYGKILIQGRQVSKN